MENNKRLDDFKTLLSKYIIQTEDIDFNQSFDYYGMNSYNAIQLIVDIELAFEMEFPDYVMVPEMFATPGTLYNCFCNIMDENPVNGFIGARE